VASAIHPQSSAEIKHDRSYISAPPLCFYGLLGEIFMFAIAFTLLFEENTCFLIGKAGRD
jgi:hypothetical protein